MRMLHAIFQIHHILPSQYAQLSYEEKVFVRQSTLETIEERNRK